MAFLRARSVGADRMSRHRTAMARAELKTRCQKEHGAEQELHGRALKEAVHVPSCTRQHGNDGC